MNFNNEQSFASFRKIDTNESKLGNPANFVEHTDWKIYKVIHTSDSKFGTLRTTAMLKNEFDMYTWVVDIKLMNSKKVYSILSLNKLWHWM